ncbi:glycosyltransferase family 2 protein [Tessaracoccus rhinocerotis]|uniref:Glycosyltransferase family 2 protein n=1 Tax=Tessaracoccus rhinocerotis TaxID=1689449 RepID=A0A553K4Y9_9ACTN|nr:glycosyltransferase family 2 protein [Tessaracoccus rhinocerotis]TRY19775.1 glycosyltransferase family 2 protein [Tessaracoccus rhinocerotis]
MSSNDEPVVGLADLWSWAAEDEDVLEHPEVDPESVTAVMVVHNAHEWLARQLLSLARLEPRPGRIVAVDNGSTDGSRALLEAALAEGVIYELVDGDAAFGFGQAVDLGIGAGTPEWVWLLHDDSAPRPDALAQLLLGVRSTGASLLFPKLLQPRRRNYPETVAEVGQSITRSGRRVLSVDEGDVDQQQEAPEPVLGGSTAGLLVRGDLWRELGGLAPEVPLHRDGVDLGWRAAEAGHVATTWPDAALTHRQAGRTGERVPGIARTSHEADRLAAMRVVAARGQEPTGPAALVVGSGLRALGFLALKSPSRAGAELRAAARFLRGGAATRALRERSVPSGDVDLSGILPDRFWSVRNAFDRFGNAVAERYRDVTATSEGETGIDELTGDDFAGSGRRVRRITSPLVVLFVVVLVAGLVAGRTLLGSGQVSGGGMLAAPANLVEAWSAFLTPVVGVPGGNAPWLGFNAFFSTFALGSPHWFAFAALLLVPLLAAFSAHRLLKQFGAGRTVSAVGGATWAGAIILLGIVTAGDMSGMVLGIAGPLLARSSHRVAVNTATGAERLRAPAGAAFWLLACAVAWPIALPLATVAGLVWLARDRHRWADLLVAVGVPWLFMLPWLPTLLRWPGRILTGADPLAWPAYPPASSATLAGRILPSGLPLWANLVFFGALGLLALVAMVRMTNARTRLVAALSIGLPLLAGVALSRLSLQVHGGESRALLSGWALLVVGALLVAVLTPHVRRETEGGSTGGLRAVLAVLALVAVLAVGTWGWIGFRGPVGQNPSQLPGYVRDVVASERDTRVLMIELVDAQSLAWNVVDRSQPTWGSGERNPSGTFGPQFAGLVQSFSGGDAPEDLAQQLSSLGVSHVWMRGFNQERLAAIGNASGLARAAADEETVVWTVLGLVSRAQLVVSDGNVPLSDGVVPEGDGTRHVLLAEEADVRWQATVGGEQVPVATGRPAVTFEVPEGVHGQFEYSLRPAWGWVAWQGLVLLAIAALAAPTLGGGATARRVAQ